MEQFSDCIKSFKETILSEFCGFEACQKMSSQNRLHVVLAYGNGMTYWESYNNNCQHVRQDLIFF